MIHRPATCIVHGYYSFRLMKSAWSDCCSNLFLIKYVTTLIDDVFCRSCVTVIPPVANCNDYRQTSAKY